MSTTTDWILAVSSMITAGGIALIVIQVFFTKKQLDQGTESIKKAAESIELAKVALEADHERSRREKLIAVMSEWEKQILPTMSAADNLVSMFTDEQCLNTVRTIPFKLEEKFNDLVKICIGLENELKIESGEIQLSKKEINAIRFLIVKYLNSLEIACSSWLQCIVDRESFKNQFQFIYRPEEPYFAQKKFRTAMGGAKAYPAIETFLNELIKDQENNSNSRNEIA